MIKFLKKIYHISRRLLAKLWLMFNKQLTVIGVVGSYGKTNTTRAIASVLSQKYKTLQTDLNLDTIYNLPITILRSRLRHQKIVLEYGVDHKGEMPFHLSLVKPKIGILTGITPTHAQKDLLGSLEGITEEKGKLLESLPKDGLLIVNWDDESARKMAKKTQAKIWRYSLEDPNVEFYAKDITINFSGTTFTLLSKDNGDIKIKTGLIGQHFVQCCLAAVAVGLYQGLNLKQIKEGLSKLKPLPGRLSIEKGPFDSVLLNDSLRANPASTLAGLKVLSTLKTKGKRIAVLGEMGELGFFAKEEHRRIGKAVSRLKIDYLISVGPLQKLTAQSALKSGMKKNAVFYVEDVVKAASILKKILKKDDLFYLKGSLLKHLERILILLENKKVDCRVSSCHFYHRCWDCLYLHKKTSSL